MHRPIVVLLLAGLASAAPAQVRNAPPGGQPPQGGYGNAMPDDSGYDDGGDGYGGGYGGYGYDAPPYRPQAPYQGGQPGMPSYQDDDRYGAGDGYDSTDARGASQGRAAPVPPPPAGSAAEYRRQQQRYRAQLDEYHRRLRDYQGTYGNGYGGGYGDRAAALRARADACERGDDAACG